MAQFTARDLADPRLTLAIHDHTGLSPDQINDPAFLAAQFAEPDLDDDIEVTEYRRGSAELRMVAIQLTPNLTVYRPTRIIRSYRPGDPQ